MVSSIFVTITQNLGPLSINASAAGGLANSPWPMFRHNLNHTGLSPYDTSANIGQLKWSFETGDMIFSSPAIGSDGTIYIGSWDEKLHAINPDGTISRPVIG
jgi:outer membrane protein assembly factor BamB